MEIVALFEAYIATGQKIDQLWNFFVTVHLAIAGVLLVSSNVNRNPWLVDICLLIAYLAFSAINFRAKGIEYKLLNVLTKEMSGVDTKYKLLNTFFDDLSFSDRSYINIVRHLVSFLITLLIYKLKFYKVS